VVVLYERGWASIDGGKTRLDSERELEGIPRFDLRRKIE
jgi:hypothetical protein